MLSKQSNHIIFFISGDFLPRHLQIFDTNEFFRGTKIQQPEALIPLKERLPQLSKDGIDFLEVDYIIAILHHIKFMGRRR